MSYADSYDSVSKAARPGGSDVWVMSRDENQARQYIRYCRSWANVLEVWARKHDHQALPGGRARQVQALSFLSGATIFALSSNPDAIVGKTGHVKLDEFALHRDQRELYAIAKPVIQWGGTLAVISTHRGAQTVFNEIINQAKHGGNPMGWSLHTIPIQRAVGEGVVERIDRKTRGQWSRQWREAGGQGSLREFWMESQRRECIDEAQWLQEYCCVPSERNSAFISFELIDACSAPGCLRGFEYLRNCANPLYLGVDVARKKDLCVLDVGEREGDVVWDRLRIELSNRPFAEIEFELYRLLELRQLKRACIDASGLGLQLAERAAERFGWKIEPITFTAPVKEELAFALRADFEQRRLRISPDDALREDLRALRKEVTLSGNYRFAGESADSHCDRFWAMALRQQAARHKVRVSARVG
jgi:phage FluMu gp28-like protein